MPSSANMGKTAYLARRPFRRCSYLRWRSCRMGRTHAPAPMAVYTTQRWRMPSVAATGSWEPSPAKGWRP